MMMDVVRIWSICSYIIKHILSLNIIIHMIFATSRLSINIQRLYNCLDINYCNYKLKKQLSTVVSSKMTITSQSLRKCKGIRRNMLSSSAHCKHIHRDIFTEDKLSVNCIYPCVISLIPALAGCNVMYAKYINIVVCWIRVSAVCPGFLRFGEWHNTEHTVCMYVWVSTIIESPSARHLASLEITRQFITCL